MVRSIRTPGFFSNSIPYRNLVLFSCSEFQLLANIRVKSAYFLCTLQSYHIFILEAKDLGYWFYDCASVFFFFLVCSHFIVLENCFKSFVWFVDWLNVLYILRLVLQFLISFQKFGKTTGKLNFRFFFLFTKIGIYF